MPARTPLVEEPIAIAAVLAAVITFAVLLTRRYAWAEKLSAVLWILFLGAATSNLGLIPLESPLYSGLIDFTVPFAVCLVLFTVNLEDLRDAGAPMLVAFAVASLGTVVGVVCASLALEPWLREILGADSWKIAGPYTGTYIGGSLNFVSLWGDGGLALGRPSLFAAANAVDNLTLFPLFAIWIAVPTLLRGRFPVAPRWHVTPSEPSVAPAAEEPTRFVVADIACLFLLALAIMAASRWLAARLDGAVPTILIVTTLALIAGQLRAVRRLAGAWELGQLAFFVFFAAVGALIDVHGAIVLAPILFAYVSIVIAFHMATVYGLGRLLRLDLAILTMASIATKSGPPTVLAMVEVRKEWKHLALPGVVVGLAGYAIGNYVGFGVAYLVRSLVE